SRSNWPSLALVNVEEVQSFILSRRCENSKACPPPIASIASLPTSARTSRMALLGSRATTMSSGIARSLRCNRSRTLLPTLDSAASRKVEQSLLRHTGQDGIPHDLAGDRSHRGAAGSLFSTSCAEAANSVPSSSCLENG